MILVTLTALLLQELMSDDHERSTDTRAKECNENRSQLVAVVDREWQVLYRIEEKFRFKKSCNKWKL